MRAHARTRFGGGWRPALLLLHLLGTTLASESNPHHHRATAADLPHFNPFAHDTGVLINPDAAGKFAKTIASSRPRGDATSVRVALEVMRAQPTAIWVDSKAKLYGPEGSATVQGSLASAARLKPSPPLVVLVLYNLPNRDCAALASAGEICCVYAADGRKCNLLSQEDGDCKTGLWEYREQFIRPIARLLAQYEAQGVPVVVILEPDSLPNVVTNSGNPRCGAATQRAYTEGIGFAISHIATVAPRTSIYVDAGHGGWLGWDKHAAAFLRLVCSDLGVSPRLIRGFSTNIANYNAIGTPCPPEAFSGSRTAGWFCNWASKNHSCCVGASDPCRRVPRYSSGASETVYVQTLAKHAAQQCRGGGGATGGGGGNGGGGRGGGGGGDGGGGGVSEEDASYVFEPHFLIDVGRAGNAFARKADECHDWCNVRSAGAGPTPTTRSALPNLIDALLWVKPPGESDGCTDLLPDGTRCERYDAGCSRPSALGGDANKDPRAPDAGDWFEAHAISLATHAELRYDGGTTRGGLRGVEARPDPALQQANGVDEDGASSSSMSRLVEKWRPSSRCLLLILGASVFSCIFACGGSIALTAGSSRFSRYWRSSSSSSPTSMSAGMAVHAKGEQQQQLPPRHRSAHAINYLCERGSHLLHQHHPNDRGVGGSMSSSSVVGEATSCLDDMTSASEAEPTSALSRSNSRAPLLQAVTPPWTPQSTTRRGTLLGGGVSDVEEEYGGATGLRDRGVPPACQLLAKRLSNEEIDS